MFPRITSLTSTSPVFFCFLLVAVSGFAEADGPEEHLLREGIADEGCDFFGRRGEERRRAIISSGEARRRGAAVGGGGGWVVVGLK